ncbi:hypothetical protein F0L67_27380 [Escherichia coli]|nr:hypothetical protein F0L67_27380 [Escherichia coli]
MFHSETNLANTDYRENRSMILSGLSLWEKGSPLHKSTQQVRTQGPIRHADCRQRKLADFLCTGGIIQGLIRRGHCCKVSDEAAFCLIQRPYISKTLLTRRISPRGSP